MKTQKLAVTSLVWGWLILFATCAMAAEDKKPATDKSTAKTTAKSDKTAKSTTKRSKKAKSSRKAAASKSKTESVSKRRLPRHFAKLDLDDRQRERVYELQAEYDAKIADLLAEIDNLKTSRDSLYRKILKPEQREKLDEVMTVSKKPRSKKSTAKVASKRKKSKKKPSEERR